MPVVAALGSAGVAVARGDAPWPSDGPPGESGPPSSGVLEPVGVGGVLDGGFEMMRAHFAVLVGLAASLLLPLQLADLWASISAGRDADLTASPILSAFGVMESALPLTWLVLVLRVVVLSFLGLVAGVLTADTLAGASRSTSAVLRSSARRWWVAVVLVVLCVPVKAASGCLIYVGFFLGDALLMCASVVAGAEGCGPFRAFGRSWSLGLKNFGTALGISIGSFVISAVMQLSLYAGPAALASIFVTSESALVVVRQIAMLSLLVTQPLTASIAARAYVELRCRGEALDLSLRRRDLGLVA